MPLVCKADEQHLVIGEVYAPNRPDSQGEFMTRDEIRKAAHEFIRSGRMAQIDVMHKNIVVKGCSVVESFIASDEDTTFIPGSWVVAVHVPDEEVWGAIKKGEINGFSMEALVQRHERDVEIDMPPVVQGITSKSDDGHEHRFYVSYDDQGNFKGGMTDFVAGHSHQIIAGTKTQPANFNGVPHTHRFSSVDSLNILVD